MTPQTISNDGPVASLQISNNGTVVGGSNVFQVVVTNNNGVPSLSITTNGEVYVHGQLLVSTNVSSETLWTLKSSLETFYPYVARSKTNWTQMTVADWIQTKDLIHHQQLTIQHQRWMIVFLVCLVVTVWFKKLGNK